MQLFVRILQFMGPVLGSVALASAVAGIPAGKAACEACMLAGPPSFLFTLSLL